MLTTKKLTYILYYISQPNKDKCQKLYKSNQIAFDNVPGSLSKHQAWTAGYIDHLFEMMKIAEKLYKALSDERHLPFYLEDVALVIFLHDLDKVWKYEKVNKQKVPIMRTPEERKQFTLKKIEEFEFDLTSEQLNAIMYIEGEGEDYNPDFRVMGKLSAFCHCCDTLSARLWFDYPKGELR